MPGYPKLITRLNHIEPVPRRIRATHGAGLVLDTVAASYVWEWSNYPAYYVPRADVRPDLLVPTGATEETPRGVVAHHSFASVGPEGPTVARLVVDPVRPELADTIRFEWEALDHWFEEDEEVYVHPRNPYTRVDAIRSTRSVRVEHQGVVLASSSSPVLVFETGLPTRSYLNRTEVRFEHLVASPTVTSCPYKGTTSEYWSVESGGAHVEDLAWSYAFPTHQLSPIAGLVAFYDEQVDVFVDEVLQDRPTSPFSP